MDDFLSESEQWDALKTWLKQNGAWIVGGVAVGALGLAGWRWWEARQDRIAQEASTKYEQVLAAFDRGDRSQAMMLIGELEREHASSPYVDQAHLAEARVAVQSGQLDKASASLQSVMEKTRDAELATVARLRLARVQMAQNKFDAALATLAAEKDIGAFKPRYREVRGDIHLARGDKAAALKEYQAARDGAARGSVDTELLDLKINDLSPPPPTGGENKENKVKGQ